MACVENALYYQKVIPDCDELDLGGLDEDALFVMAVKFPATISRAVDNFIFSQENS